MAMTRAQAQTLLNQAEMSLYGDSRINGLRGLDAGQLAKRVERARKARDRARDLLQRQRLASRERTGSKRGASGAANQRSKLKAGLLVDILKRFEAQLKLARKQEKSEMGVATRKSAAKTVKKTVKAPVKKVVKKAVGKTAAKAARKTSGKTVGKPAPAKRVAKQATAPAVAAKANTPSAQAAPAKAAKSTGKRRKQTTARITPEQALANTRRLLEAKNERAHEARPWHSLDSGHHVPEPGFQSPQAAAKAQELHAGESRMASIQGSISTHDRKNQGKRDNRGSGSEA